ncbi:MAG: protein translocase subunit SecDF [Muribaculaceae bacterium]|nr:protein translocase subunit SecDF [Muribaculaceae bacterium]
MQTKGFIRVLTWLLILICLFYLGFTFVSNHYQNKAEQKALAVAGIKSPDTSNEQYKIALNEYLDSIANKKVYPILMSKWFDKGYTFQEVREKELGLGLDLKGGMNVTLQISVPDILRALANNNPDKKFNQAIDNVANNQTAQDDFVGSFCKEYKKLAPEGNLAQIFRNIERVKEKPNATDAEVQSILNEEVNSMVDNSYKVLRNRIDRFGVVQPNIQKLASTGRILLELPGVKEPERVRKLLQGAANLEFYTTYKLSDVIGALRQLSDQAIAETTTTTATDTTATTDAAPKPAAAPEAAADSAAAKKEAPKAKKETAETLAQLTSFEALAANQGGSPVVGYVLASDTTKVNAIINSKVAKTILPSDLKLAWTVKPEKMQGGHETFQLVALQTVNGQPVLNGDVVTRATSEYDNLQGQVVSMTMNDEGARQWSRITGQNIGKAIAIVLDDQVYSFPNVNSQIDGGRSQISGRFTVEEASDLANVLESGKMVARVNVASESVIGPSLGKESIQKGLRSFGIALVLLMIFMWLAYGWQAGSIAILGLILNLFFTMGILASFQSVLTLPGIAGIVLTLGMAVDANVLIFERCKEELRAGKGLKAAVSDGYKNAFSAIFDSNLTTIITGIILILLGSGPIRGFAVTLVIGICCSFFTAVFATRLVMEHFVNKGTFDNMTFNTRFTRHLMENVSFDFMGAAKKTAFFVLGLIVLMGILFAARGLNRGIDFSGGRNFVVQFDHPVKTQALEDQLTPLFDGANTSVITIDNDTKVRVSTNYKIKDTSEGVDDEIMDKLYTGLKSELGNMTKDDFSMSNESVGVVSSETVGPSIASDMTRQAIWAVLFSLLAMALYILIRFRNIAFSIGALAAVAFTAFIVIGFYNLHGLLPFSMEIDQTFIAAILTVIGYQVNDTVVVFDRVREYRSLYPKQDLYTTFNKALCSTLSRTMMTSITTLLVLIIMLIFGGESIRSFIFAMILGVIIGTCSSLFIASPVAYWIARRSDKKEAKLATARK